MFRPTIAAIIRRYSNNITGSFYIVVKSPTFYSVVKSPDDGRNCRPKHVVYVTNKLMLEHLRCCFDRITIENYDWTNKRDDVT